MSQFDIIFRLVNWRNVISCYNLSLNVILFLRVWVGCFRKVCFRSVLYSGWLIYPESIFFISRKRIKLKDNVKLVGKIWAIQVIELSKTSPFYSKSYQIKLDNLQPPLQVDNDVKKYINIRKEWRWRSCTERSLSSIVCGQNNALDIVLAWKCIMAVVMRMTMTKWSQWSEGKAFKLTWANQRN